MGLLKAWSYSRYRDHNQCALKAKYKYIDKIPEASSPALEHGDDVHKISAAYLRGDLPVNDPIPGWTYFKDLLQGLRELNPLVEQEWGFTNKWRSTGWFGNDTWFRSKLDAAVLYDDEADIVDFKTGKPRPDETSQQAELYFLSVIRRYPQIIRAAARFWYVDAGVKMPDSQRETVYRFNADMAPELMERWNKRALRVLNDERFPPTPGTHCKWCPFAASKGGPCKYGK